MYRTNPVCWYLNRETSLILKPNHPLPSAVPVWKFLIKCIVLVVKVIKTDNCNGKNKIKTIKSMPESDWNRFDMSILAFVCKDRTWLQKYGVNTSTFQTGIYMLCWTSDASLQHLLNIDLQPLGTEVTFCDELWTSFENLGGLGYDGASGCWSIKSNNSSPIPKPSIRAMSLVFNLGFGILCCFNQE